MSESPIKMIKKSSRKMIDPERTKFQDVINKSIEDLEGLKK